MLTHKQERVIERLELPGEGWTFDDEGSATLTIELEGYSDRWFISDDGSMSVQERSEDGATWFLMCPDCGYPADSEEHLSGG